MRNHDPPLWGGGREFWGSLALGRNGGVDDSGDGKEGEEEEEEEEGEEDHKELGTIHLEFWHAQRRGFAVVEERKGSEAVEEEEEGEEEEEEGEEDDEELNEVMDQSCFS